MEIVRETATALRTEAESVNERRLLVLSGDRHTSYEAAQLATDAIGIDRPTVISDAEIVADQDTVTRTDKLLGTTHDCLITDCHDSYRPNMIGRATGAVDGGGLLIPLIPTKDDWLNTPGQFDQTLAPPPYSASNVGNRFKQRLLRTLSTHRGVAIIDVDSEERIKDGCIDPVRRRPLGEISPPATHSFPRTVYEACLTADQLDAVHACETLSEDGTAVVLESDRGRGKSSAAGLAAAAYAADGSDVLVSAPSYRNAAELFERAAEMLDTLNVLIEDARDGARKPTLHTECGGVRYLPPEEAIDASADILFVDEAAGIPVRTLESLTSVAPSVCFATTVHGYEGAGHGFDVRFREKLSELRDRTDCILLEPIRYASGDPIEVWQSHALLLGATPPPSELFDDVSVEDVTYERLDRGSLAENEPLLGEVFGSLVSAHYRTEPDDLARLLDAPNVAVRALMVDTHPISVALLSREGGLDEPTRRIAYEGDRIQGNLLPDLLMSQLRDPDAGVPVGFRVLRIATHRAVRSEGFGSRLLAEIETEFRADGEEFDPIDYLGVSYGATPELLTFWEQNDYRTIHLSATKNDASGEHSAVMIRPLSEAGRELADRHTDWFLRRVPDVLAGVLLDLDPDVVRTALGAVDRSPSIELTAFEWRLVASAAYGPGLYDTAPGAFKQLAFKTLVDETLEDASKERLLVMKVLQTTDWEVTANRLGYVSRRECMRTLGETYQPIVDRYGTDVARSEAERHRE